MSAPTTTTTEVKSNVPVLPPIPESWSAHAAKSMMNRIAVQATVDEYNKLVEPFKILGAAAEAKAGADEWFESAQSTEAVRADIEAQLAKAEKHRAAAEKLEEQAEELKAQAIAEYVAKAPNEAGDTEQAAAMYSFHLNTVKNYVKTFVESVPDPDGKLWIKGFPNAQQIVDGTRKGVGHSGTETWRPSFSKITENGEDTGVDTLSALAIKTKISRGMFETQLKEAAGTSNLVDGHDYQITITDNGKPRVFVFTATTKARGRKAAAANDAANDAAVSSDDAA